MVIEMKLPNVAIDHETGEVFEVKTDVVFGDLIDDNKINEIIMWMTEKYSGKYWIGYDRVRLSDKDFAVIFKLTWG